MPPPPLSVSSPPSPLTALVRQTASAARAGPSILNLNASPAATAAAAAAADASVGHRGGAELAPPDRGPPLPPSSAAPAASESTITEGTDHHRRQRASSKEGGAEGGPAESSATIDEEEGEGEEGATGPKAHAHAAAAEAPRAPLPPMSADFDSLPSGRGGGGSAGYDSEATVEEGIALRPYRRPRRLRLGTGEAAEGGEGGGAGPAPLIAFPNCMQHSSPPPPPDGAQPPPAKKPRRFAPPSQQLQLQLAAASQLEGGGAAGGAGGPGVSGTPFAPEADAAAEAAVFFCRLCGRPSIVRHGVKPAFVCLACPSMGGRDRRAQVKGGEGGGGGRRLPCLLLRSRPAPRTPLHAARITPLSPCFPAACSSQPLPEASLSEASLTLLFAYVPAPPPPFSGGRGHFGAAGGHQRPGHQPRAAARGGAALAPGALPGPHQGGRSVQQAKTRPRRVRGGGRGGRALNGSNKRPL